MIWFKPKITADEVKAIIPSGMKLIFDRRFILPQDAEVKESISAFIKKRGDFRYGEFHDCDNAAIELLNWVSGKGWPFAFCAIPGHAINLYINDQRELKFIEPQTGKERGKPQIIKITFMT